MNQPANEHGQFFRVEKFAIQAPRGKLGGNNIQKVANEAARTQGFCSHIENTVPPTLIYGVGPIEAASRAESWARQRSCSVFHQPSQSVKLRKYRADQPCALVGVISVPPEWTADSRWDGFVSQCVGWLKTKYGDDRLHTVLAHRDERCLHLHFWVIPRGGEDFSSVHQGEKAIDDAGRKSSRLIRDVAYKAAMAELQDEFHEAVGLNFGFERMTVGGERLSRSDWLRNKELDRLREVSIRKRIDDEVAEAVRRLQLNRDDENQIAGQFEMTNDVTKLRRHGPKADHDPVILAANPASSSSQVSEDLKVADCMITSLLPVPTNYDSENLPASSPIPADVTCATASERENSWRQCHSASWIRPRCQ